MTPIKIFGRGGGLFSEGNVIELPSSCRAILTPQRPYLHVYKHSNEIEEITVISLDGVNVESNPEMESLLGVSATCFLVHVILTRLEETIYLHPLYLLKLTRTCGAKLQGAAGMDNQTGSYTYTIVIMVLYRRSAVWVLATRLYTISPWNSTIPHVSYHSFILLEAMYAARYPTHDNHDFQVLFPRFISSGPLIHDSAAAFEDSLD